MNNEILEKFNRINRRFKNIEENMATKSDVKKIMDKLNVLVGMFKKHEQEFIFMKNEFECNKKMKAKKILKI